MPRSAKSSTSSLEKVEDENFEIPDTIEVTDILDLHGTPVGIIPEMIDAFIENALELKLSRVQIIHGKGKSKLKYLTYQILKQHADVLLFYDALPEMGGWGRTIVELATRSDAG